MKVAVQGHDICVKAGKKHILKSCSFAWDEGRFVGILGPNGAGKTTLLGLCNGLIRLSSGRMQCLGMEVDPSNSVRLRKRIAYVSQWRMMDSWQPISVYESVLSGTYGRLGLWKNPGKKEHSRAEEALAAVSASHLAARPLGHLSGGEAQRIAIARALVQEPELLLLDEPTASLDWQSRREILHLIGLLRNRSKLTIVMVTHELNAVPDLCDEVLFMQDGVIVWQGNVQEAMDAERLSALYSTQVEIFYRGDKPIVLI